MSLLKQPGWLRGLEVGAGLLSLMLAISVFVFPALGVATSSSCSPSVSSSPESGLSPSQGTAASPRACGRWAR